MQCDGQYDQTAVTTRTRITLIAFSAALISGWAALAGAVAPTPVRVAELCKEAEGPAHCGRLIEAEQLRGLPNLALREGDTLRVTLFPSGNRELVDTESIHGSKTFAVWDYWSSVNTVVLFTTDLDRTGFALLQRANGRLIDLPAEPVLAPDRQHLAVADFCASGCDNELSVWRIGRDGVRRESTWKPAQAWSDVTLTWRDGETLDLEFTRDGQTKPEKKQLRLADAGWQRANPR